MKRNKTVFTHDEQHRRGLQIIVINREHTFSMCAVCGVAGLVVVGRPATLATKLMRYCVSPVVSTIHNTLDSTPTITTLHTIIITTTRDGLSCRDINTTTYLCTADDVVRLELEKPAKAEIIFHNFQCVTQFP